MIRPDSETMRAIARLETTPDFRRFAEFLATVEQDETATLLAADRECLSETRARVLAFHDLNELIQTSADIVRQTDQLSATGTPHM